MLLMVFLYGLSKFNIPVNAKTDDWVFDLGQFREQSYQRIHKGWLNQTIKYQGNDVLVYASDQTVHNSNVTLDTDAFVLDQGEQSKWIIVSPVDAVYHIELNYAVMESFSTPPTIEVMVDGKLLFNEMTDLPLPVKWSLQDREEEDKV